MAADRSSIRIAAWSLAIALGGAGSLPAQSVERISVDSAGGEADRASKWSGVSDDGNLVVFDSDATNLVASDTNGVTDIFLRDRLAGTTVRLSVGAGGVEADGESLFPALTPDGRHVAFSSEATNLVAGDTNGVADIFLLDRVAGTLERISVGAAGVEADDDSDRPSISADGRFVSFFSYATNLVPGDGNRVADIFVVDRLAGTIERVSVDSAGNEADDGSYVNSIAADGVRIAFVSDATNLVAGDTNDARDAFVHDRSTGVTVRVSVDSAGNEGAGGKTDSSRLSPDGSICAFSSSANLLVPNDSNNRFDIFVHDLATGTTELVSADPSGAPGDRASLHPRLSADGRFILFQSSSALFDPADTNGAHDLFLRDRHLGVTRRISVDPNGVEGDDDSHVGWISSDGAWITAHSAATNLVPGDTNGVEDILLFHYCLPASWSNYGSGFAGALGVPAFTLRADPVLGTTVTADLADSTGQGTLAVVLIGLDSAQIPTGFGGTLLVSPIGSITLAVPAGGATIDADLPDDEALCGVSYFAQALELDAAAAKGVSFTAGLELALGR
ncbi:MAG: calcium-binding protein [Planctomycetes bacterium]|nr:calcium-binding protein [Planctomycetota bacterium]